MQTKALKRGRPALFIDKEICNIGFSLSNEQLEAVDNLAEISGTGRSRVMRDLIDSYALYLAKARLQGKIQKLKNVLDKTNKMKMV